MRKVSVGPLVTRLTGLQIRILSPGQFKAILLVAALQEPAGSCRRSLLEIFTMTFRHYLSAAANYWLLWPPPALAQVQGDCGKYLGGILMRIIERHLYFTLLPSPSPLTPIIFQTSSRTIFGGRRLIPLDSVVNL